MSTSKNASEEKSKGNLVGPAKWVANVDRILFSQADIQQKIAELGTTISKHYEGKSVLAVAILKGSFVFASDLCRALTVPCQLDFITLSSYGSEATSSGSIKVKKDLDINPSGQHVLVLEDLIDTGTTLKWLINYLQSKNCASVQTACLLDKKTSRKTNMKVEYVGFDCPNEFVIGYGMDFNENYRTLPYVGVLKAEAIPKRAQGGTT